MLIRPALIPRTRLLHRAPGSVQLGMCPQTGVVLTGLSQPEVTLLTLLDGTRDMSWLRRWTRKMGADPDRVEHLIEQLASRGLLREGVSVPNRPSSAGPPAAYAEATALRLRHRLPAGDPDLVAARTRRMIVVDGEGNLVDSVSATLRDSGYAVASARAWFSSGQPPSPTRSRRATRPAPDTPVSDASSTPDLIVLAVADALPHGDVEFWDSCEAAVLPLVTNGSTVQIGPLLVASGPCPRCLDLHRADRDPAWPELLAQLSQPATEDPAAATVSSSVAALAAGVSATMAIDYLDVHRVISGRAFEVRPQAPYLLSRRWTPHPRCACAPGPVTMSA